MNNFKIIAITLLVTISLFINLQDVSAKRTSQLPIHGIAVNPNNPDTLYVATHIGLLLCNAKECELVGNDRSDYMGFAISTDGKTFLQAAMNSQQAETGD